MLGWALFWELPSPLTSSRHSLEFSRERNGSRFVRRLLTVNAYLRMRADCRMGAENCKEVRPMAWTRPTMTWRPSPLLYMMIGYMALFIIRPFEVWPVLGDLYLERIYMIALLAVSLTSLQQLPTLDTVGRSVAVFVGVVTLSLVASSYFTEGIAQW